MPSDARTGAVSTSASRPALARATARMNTEPARFRTGSAMKAARPTTVISSPTVIRPSSANQPATPATAASSTPEVKVVAPRKPASARNAPTWARREVWLERA